MDHRGFERLGKFVVINGTGLKTKGVEANLARGRFPHGLQGHCWHGSGPRG